MSKPTDGIILKIFSHGFKKEKNPDDVIKESTDNIKELKKDRTKLNNELNNIVTELTKFKETHKNKKPQDLKSNEKIKLVQLLKDERLKTTKIDSLTHQINTIERSINIYQDTDSQIKTNKSLSNLNEITKNLKANDDFMNEIEDTLADTQENNENINEINQLIQVNNNKMDNIDESTLLNEFFDDKNSELPDDDDLLKLNSLKTSITINNNKPKKVIQPVINDDDDDDYFNKQLSDLPVIKSTLNLNRNQVKIVTNTNNKSHEDSIWGNL